jgi:hypothetical protein
MRPAHVVLIESCYGNSSNLLSSGVGSFPPIFAFYSVSEDTGEADFITLRTIPFLIAVTKDQYKSWLKSNIHVEVKL